MVKPDLQTGLRAMGNSVRWFADQLAAVLMVSRCAACKGVVLHARRLPICSACLEKFPSLNEPLCQRCGRPLATPAGRLPQCFACRRGAYAFDRARSCAPYLEPAVTMIELLKRHPIRPLAAWLTGHMQGVLQQVPEFGAVDALVRCHSTAGDERSAASIKPSCWLTPLADGCAFRFGRTCWSVFGRGPMSCC